jgi:hypothetical protein
VGHKDNTINSEGASILGGGSGGQLINQISGGNNSVVAGGIGNRIFAPNAIIGGGDANDVQGNSSLI